MESLEEAEPRQDVNLGSVQECEFLLMSSKERNRMFFTTCVHGALNIYRSIWNTMNTNNNTQACLSGQRAAGSAVGKLPPDPLYQARMDRVERERRLPENRLRGSSTEKLNKHLDEVMDRLKVGQLWELDDPAFILPNGRCRVIKMPPVLITEGPFRTPNDVFVRVVPLDIAIGSIGWKETSEDEVRLTKGKFSRYAVCLWEERPASSCQFEDHHGELSEGVRDQVMRARQKFARGEASLPELSDLRNSFRNALRNKFKHISHLTDWRRCALEEFIEIGGDIKKYVPYNQLCDGSGGWITDHDVSEIIDAMFR